VGHGQGDLLAELSGVQMDAEVLHLAFEFGDALGGLVGDGSGSPGGPRFEVGQGRLKHGVA